LIRLYFKYGIIIAIGRDETTPITFIKLRIMNILRNYISILTFTLFCVFVQAKSPIHKILVTSIKQIKATNESVSITCNLFNVGRQSIIFNNELTPDIIDFKFEESFSRSKLFCYKKEIIAKLLNSNIEIKRGKMLRAIPIQISAMKDSLTKNVKKRKSKRIKKTESIFANSERSEKRKKKKQKRKKEDEITFSASESIKKSKESHHLKNVCVDIVIDTIIVKKYSKNYITIEYTLSNQGKADANLYGELHNENDNLALKVFLGRSKNITRGSIPLGGTFIERGIKHGILKVGSTYTSTMKLSTKDLTKFTPYLILKVDPFNVMNECHRRNNDKGILIDVK